MRKITILAVGKLREPFYEEAAGEYAKRLKKYCEMEIKEVAEDRMESAAREQKGFLIACEIKGAEHSSESFARELERLSMEGESHLVFLIGGAEGLPEEVKKCAALQLSFSRMTFPHQLMRVILLEQLYRAFKILRKEPYHK